MKAIPIVDHCRPDPPRSWTRAVAPLAATIRGERPDLALPIPFQELRVGRLEEGPSLLLDDLSEIPGLDRGHDARFYQDRARLRAGDDDLVASCADFIPGLENYCRDYLGLGSPEWLRPPPSRQALGVAEACWTHQATRIRLIEKLRRDELRYLHPHMGTFSAWELAFLLQREARRPLAVIAPPPGLTRWANDKIAFANTVVRLFGPELVPRTESACNLAYLAKRIRELANESEVIGLKLPNSGGGGGNLVISAARIRRWSLKNVRQRVKECLRKLDWDGSSAVLIDRWETQVVCSPSAQLWIPPEPGCPPVVEGIFVQATEGPQGNFAGNTPSQFPSALHQEIVDRCWVLGNLLQRLGYVGRCSFDMILVGPSLHDCRIELIECNGRWGGTSLPMTLMNRIFGDWRRRSYAVRVAHHIAGLDRLSFAEVLDAFRPELFDVRTGMGSLIFINPGRLRSEAGITALIISDSWRQAAAAADRLPGRLRRLARVRAPGPRSTNDRRPRKEPSTE